MEQMTEYQITLMGIISKLQRGTYVGYLADVTLRHPQKSVMLSNLREMTRIRVDAHPDLVYDIVYQLLHD